MLATHMRNPALPCPGLQDRYFFETLYSTLITLADEAFSKLQRRPDIEREVRSRLCLRYVSRG
eukprot:358152-Chlamydomonas_euryale.AAC.12